MQAREPLLGEGVQLVEPRVKQPPGFGRGLRDRLHETGGRLDEDEFARDGRALAHAALEAMEALVGCELDEVGGVFDAQVALRGGEGAHHGFYLANDRVRASAVASAGHDLVDAAGDLDAPVADAETGLERNLEERGRKFLDRLPPQFLVPRLPELGAQGIEAHHPRARGAGGKLGKLAHAQRDGAISGG